MEHRLNVKHKNINLLEKTIGENLSDISRVKQRVLDFTSKAWPTKEKKFNFALYNTQSRRSTTTTKQEKILANHIFNKGLVSRIYKELWKLNNEKTNKYSIRKWIKNMEKIH